jgi:hypothetical protein
MGSTHKIKWYNTVAGLPLGAAIGGAVLALNALRAPYGGSVNVGLVAGMAGVAVVGLIGTLLLRRRFGGHLHVDALGLTWLGRGAWTWDRVLWTTYTPPGSARAKIRLWLDGVPSELGMNSVTDPHGFLAAMDTFGAAHVKARIASALTGGQAMTWRRFGSSEIRIDALGVSDGKRAIPWSDLALVDGDLLVPRSAGRIHQALGHIDLNRKNLPCPDLMLAAFERRQPNLRAPT